MARISITDGSSGPYPGRTWVAEVTAQERKAGVPFLFGYGVPRAVRPGTCGTCGTSVDPAWHYCSRRCFKTAEWASEAEGRAEALGS